MRCKGLKNMFIYYNNCYMVHSYTKETLDILFTKDNCKLNGILPKRLVSSTIISFVCQCGTPNQKTFRVLLENGGGYCNVCTRSNAHTKHMKARDLKYDISIVNTCSIRDQFSLIEKLPEFILRDTIIKFKCRCGILTEKSMKNVEMFGGFCKECMTIEMISRQRKTNMENLGVSYPLLHPDMIQKSKDTNMQKLGVENPMQSNVVREKAMVTLFNNYGVTHPLQSEIIKKRMEETYIKNHGCHPMQNPEIAIKNLKSALCPKIFTFPSGNQVQYQGYEGSVLKLLVNEGVSEDDIVVSRLDVPEIWWFDTMGKIHRYYVDILIKPNKMIEVKSDYTFSKEYFANMRKQRACIYMGYTHEIWIMAPNGSIIDIV